MAKLYGQIAGVVLLLLGVLGFVLAGPLFGLINSDVFEDIVHLATGALFAYAGFMTRGAATRSIVGGLGVFYLLVGVLGFIAPTLFGLVPSGYSTADNVVHLLLGIAGVGTGYMMRDADVDTAVERRV